MPKPTIPNFARSPARDPLSPVLFNAALEAILRRCKRGWLEKGFGVCIDGDTQRLTNLRFADDIVLAALSFDDLTEMIGDLANHAAQFGLAIHPEKIPKSWGMFQTKREQINLEPTQ